MALEKNYDYKGRAAKYWRISRIINDYMINKTTVEVRLYWDKAARDENSQNYLGPIELRAFDITDLTIEQAYEKIKTSTYFNDAKSV
jgi:hypothetical protein